MIVYSLDEQINEIFDCIVPLSAHHKDESPRDCKMDQQCLCVLLPWVVLFGLPNLHWLWYEVHLRPKYYLNDNHRF